MKTKFIKTILSGGCLIATSMPLFACSAKQEINTIPQEALDIQNNTLYGVKVGADLSKYNTLQIPDSVANISPNAFANSVLPPNINTIYFGNGIQDIGENAFANCKHIQKLIFNNKLYTWFVNGWDRNIFNGFNEDGKGEIVYSDLSADEQFELYYNLVLRFGLSKKWIKNIPVSDIKVYATNYQRVVDSHFSSNRFHLNIWLLESLPENTKIRVTPTIVTKKATWLTIDCTPFFADVKNNLIEFDLKFVGIPVVFDRLDVSLKFEAVLSNMNAQTVLWEQTIGGVQLNIDETVFESKHNYVTGGEILCGFKPDVTEEMILTELTDQFVVPREFDIIVDNAFYDTVNDKSLLPSTVTSLVAWSGTATEEQPDLTYIGKNAFKKSSIENAIISTYQIAESAFESTNLEKVELLKTIKTISPNAFKGCSKLNEAKFVDLQSRWLFDDSTQKFKPSFDATKNVAALTTTYSSSTWTKKHTILDITSPEEGTITLHGFLPGTTDAEILDEFDQNTLIIPNDIAVIDQYAFSGHNKSILPDAITKLEFETLKSTEETRQPSLIAIGKNAFSYSNIQSAVIPNNVTYIGENAFVGCTNMTNIEIPQKIEWLGKQFINMCSKLQTVKFYGTDRMPLLFSDDKTCVFTPSNDGAQNLEYFDNHGRYNFVSNKTTLNFEQNDEGWCKCIGFRTGTTVEQINKEFSDKTLKLPTLVNEFAFDTASKQLLLDSEINKVDFSANTNLKALSAGAFEDNTTIENVVLPESLIKIEQDTFKNCRSLTTVNIPTCCTSIGTNAFTGATSLATANFGGVLATWTLDDAITTTIRVRDKTAVEMAAYLKTAETANYTWTTNKNVLSVTKNGEQYELNGFVSGVTDEQITEIYGKTLVIPEEITRINNDCFIRKVWLSEKTEVWETTIPETIKNLKFNCTNLGYIGSYAFACCPDLGEIKIPDTVLTMGNNVFANARTSLYVLPKNEDFTSIPECGFMGSEIKKITIPSNVVTMNSKAFADSELAEIIIPKTVTKLNGSVFRNSKLQVIDVSDFETVPIKGWSPTQTYGGISYNFIGCPKTGAGVIYVNSKANMQDWINLFRKNGLKVDGINWTIKVK